MEDNNTELHKNNSTQQQKKRINILRLGFFAVLLLIFIAVIKTIISDELDHNNPTSSSFTNNDPKLYSSAEYGFKISFPGFPSIDRQTLNSGGRSIPYTIYEVDINGIHESYLVAAYDFTSVELDETKALEGAINGATRGMEGSELVNTQFSTFLGLKSIEAYYTAPDDGVVYDLYARGFFKESKMYLILVHGVDKAKFNKFADSFQFTQYTAQ